MPFYLDFLPLPEGVSFMVTLIDNYNEITTLMFTGHMKRISHTLPGILAVFFMLSVTITVLMSRAKLSHLISTGYEIRVSDDRSWPQDDCFSLIM